MEEQQTSVKGLDDAKAIIETLQVLSVSESYAEFVGNPRVGDNLSNQELLQYLADGGRDLRSNNEDEAKAMLLVANEITKQMNVPVMVNGAYKARTELMIAGITGGLRKAVKYITKQMFDRLKSGVDNTGTKKPVSCLLYTSPSPRDGLLSRMPSSA